MKAAFVGISIAAVVATHAYAIALDIPAVDAAQLLIEKVVQLCV